VEDRVFIESADQNQVPQLEVREHYITILDPYLDLGVVTVIELVSPSNKPRGPAATRIRPTRRKS
jgi:hypothetical protein